MIYRVRYIELGLGFVGVVVTVRLEAGGTDAGALGREVAAGRARGAVHVKGLRTGAQGPVRGRSARAAAGVCCAGAGCGPRRRRVLRGGAWPREAPGASESLLCLLDRRRRRGACGSA